jgi:hypothetical protein
MFETSEWLLPQIGPTSLKHNLLYFMYVGPHPYLIVVAAGNIITVLCLAR